MVNASPADEIRHKIIQRLFEASDPVSGQGLSEELGVSRVAVWKHIQALQERGCLISSCSRGYTLDRLPDGLSSWNFPRLDFPILVRDSCNSTMDTAREALQSYDPPFAVAADRQEHGVSGSGTEWPSDIGGIYASIVIPVLFDFIHTGRYNVIASLAICRILDRRNIDAAYMWPRGIFLEGQKIGGVITEIIGPFDAPKAISLGLGLYVHNQHDKNCISLAGLLRESLSRRDLLEDILLEIQILSTGALDDQIEKELYSFCLQAECTLSAGNGSEDRSGTVCGISSRGELVYANGKSNNERSVGSWESASLEIYNGDIHE